MIRNLHETFSIPLESLIGTPGKMRRRAM
jgi:hypothetical protein